MATPVVLLAFANDRADGARYLRNLPEERRAVLAALDGAAAAGVCEVAVLPNTTAGELLDAFRRHRDRVAVLHFGGHAGSYALLLEDAAGRPDAAGGEGLAAFLAAQRGLELVVLNACATEGHVRRLLAAGVPAVVATSRAVEDAVALEFARQLYRGLGAGSGVRRAFDEASAAVRLQRGDVPNASPGSGAGGHRDIGGADGGGTGGDGVGDGLAGDGGWPWALYVRDGAERAERWTFAEAAGDPLWGLPPLPALPPPERPFRHLAPFGREHAAVFFGRGAEVRELYDRVTGPDGPPVVLLYGQTGVGKSSLLDAGLLPRLEASHAVRYARRDHARGLLGTLADALGAWDGTPAAAAAAWAGAEWEAGRPLLVVLDQLEEAFTRAESDSLPRTGESPVDPAGAPARELDALAAAVAELFGDPERRPLGRLVLGFRKEWLAEVEGAFAQHRVPRGKQFLGRLTRAGVAAAVAGPAQAPALRAQYGLAVEDGLAELIADDLLADRESHVAPVLQILLAGMWDRAVRRSASAPRFDRALYDESRAQGVHLDAFLEQQLAALRAWHPPAVESGLALDYLAAHTTPLGTARERSAAEDAAQYPQARAAPPPGLRARCTELYLLTERAGDAAGDDAGGPSARLAHDTLAPLVRRRVEQSEAPGQRARRALEARAGDWADGREAAPLDDYDLTVVEGGAEGMRAWTADEARLVDASRAAREARRRERARRRRLNAAGVALLAVLVVVAGIASVLARSRAEQAESVALATRAREFGIDAPDLALLAAAAAVERASTPEARVALLEAARRARGLAMAVPRATFEQFTADSIYVTYDGRTAVRWDPSGHRPADTLAYPGFAGRDSAFAATFSPDGRTLAALARAPQDRTPVLVVQTAGSPPVVLARVGPQLGLRGYSPAPGSSQGIAFSPDGRRLAVASHVLDLQNRRTRQLLLVWRRPAAATGAAPSRFVGPDTISLAEDARPNIGPLLVRQLAFSPDGRWVAASADPEATVTSLFVIALPSPGTVAPQQQVVGQWNTNGRIHDLAVSNAGVVTTTRTRASETSPRSTWVTAERWTTQSDSATHAWTLAERRTTPWFALRADANAFVRGDGADSVEVATLVPASPADSEPAAATLGVFAAARDTTDTVAVSPGGRYAAIRLPRVTLLAALPREAATMPQLPWGAGDGGDVRLSADGRRVLVKWYADRQNVPPGDSSLVGWWLARYDRRTGAADTLFRGPALGAYAVSPGDGWLVTTTGREGAPTVVRWRLPAATGTRPTDADTLPFPDGVPADATVDALAVDDHGAVRLRVTRADTAADWWELRPGARARRLAGVPAARGSGPMTLHDGWVTVVDQRRGCALTLARGGRLHAWNFADGAPRQDCVPAAAAAATTESRYADADVREDRVALVTADGAASVWDLDASRAVAVLAADRDTTRFQMTEDVALAASGWLYRVVARQATYSTATHRAVDSVAVGYDLLAAEACRLASSGATRLRWDAELRGFDPPRRCGRR